MEYSNKNDIPSSSSYSAFPVTSLRVVIFGFSFANVTFSSFFFFLLYLFKSYFSFSFLLYSNHRSSHIPSSLVHAGCVFVAGIHPSGTWMSGSF